MPDLITIDQLSTNPNPLLSNLLHVQAGSNDYKTTVSQILSLLTSSQVKSLLESLTGTNRLSAAAVKDITAQITAGSNSVLARADTSPGTVSEVALGLGQLLGRGSTGNITAIVLGSGLNLTGTTLSATTVLTDGDKGDITVSNSGTTWTVDAEAITYNKIQNATANTVLARNQGTSGTVGEVLISNNQLLGRGDTGNIAPITLGSNLTMSGTTLSATSSPVTDGDKGDITVSDSGSTWTIDNQAVSYNKIQNLSANTVLARSSTTAGVVQEVTLSPSQLLGRGSTGDISPITLGSGLTISGNSISTTGGTTTEDIQDAAASLLVNGVHTGITATYDDANNRVNLTTSGTGLTDGDKGDITVSAGGTSWAIDPQAVTYSKLQNATANTVIGRAAATSGTVGEVSIGASQLLGRGSVGDVAAINVGSGLNITGTTLTATGVGITDGDKGDITVTANGTVWTIDPQSVDYGNIQNATANTVIARAASTSGTVGEVALAASQLLGRGSTGDISAITLGSGLSMTGTTLAASGGGGGFASNVHITVGTTTSTHNSFYLGTLNSNYPDTLVNAPISPAATEVLDGLNEWNTSTGAFVPQATGYYLISAFCHWSNTTYINGPSVGISIHNNASSLRFEIARMPVTATAQEVRVHGSTIMQLVAGQEYRPAFGRANISSNTTVTSARFSVFRLA